MPGFLTHYLGGQAVLARLPEDTRKLIEGDHARIYNLGTQGPDIFFYYVPGFMRVRSKGIGSDIHEADFGKFFMETARWVKHETLFAYLAGFLAHYALDTACHPFVFAHTQLKGATSAQESAEHRHFETAVDVLMLARIKGEKPADYKQWELIQAPPKHKQVAAAAFAAAANKVYGDRRRGGTGDSALLPRDVYHAMGHMAQLTRMLHSPKGRRKKWAAFLEDKTIGARLLSAMVHMQEVTDGRDYLNLSRTHWHTPWNPSQGSTASFPELFDAGVGEAVQMVNGLYAYMQGTMPRKKLTELIGNRSLSTGMDFREGELLTPCE
ncbi:MAG: zinc dependent phospholipase C family protein [Defluviitaleaceae bacterium]|nr:zinc dependent phospholipase C family protein [Defluviitaleaceae bacterium]